MRLLEQLFSPRLFLLHFALHFRMCVAVGVYNETKSDLHKGFQKLSLSRRFCFHYYKFNEYNTANEL